MAITRAEAKKRIRGELRSLLVHRIKVLTADPVRVSKKKLRRLLEATYDERKRAEDIEETFQ